MAVQFRSIHLLQFALQKTGQGTSHPRQALVLLSVKEEFKAHQLLWDAVRRSWRTGSPSPGSVTAEQDAGVKLPQSSAGVVTFYLMVTYPVFMYK